MKYQFIEDVRELLELPFAFAEIPHKTKNTVNSCSFFNQACYAIGNNIDDIEKNIGGKTLIYCLIKGLSAVYFHNYGNPIDPDNYVSIFLKYHDKSIRNNLEITSYAIKFENNAIFYFQDKNPKYFSTISLSKTIQIFRDYLALKEKKYKEPTVEQFYENEKRIKELEAQLANIKEDNEKLKTKNKQISEVISGM